MAHIEKIRRILSIYLLPLFIGYYYLLPGTIKNLLKSDFKRWCEWKKLTSDALTFCYFFQSYKEFRSICYNRLHWRRLMLPIFFRGQTNLTLACRKIGPGLIIQHGYSTVVVAESIGKNCHINQCVNIVWNGDARCSIGDNVNVFVGAIIIGGVKIGNNVTIAAGAVVNKNVPDNSLVIGNPMRIIQRI